MFLFLSTIHRETTSGAQGTLKACPALLAGDFDEVVDAGFHSA